MSQDNGRLRRFRVSFRGAARDEFGELAQQAAAEGRGYEFLSAFRRITYELRTRADTFGELRFNYTHPPMGIRVGGVAPLIVHYGLSLEQPIVIIRGFILLQQA